MGRNNIIKASQGVALCAGLAFLGGCDENGQFAMPQGAPDETQTTDGTQSTKLIERDVEAPEVFQVAEPGLWDGRPSLGGVWVAHPDVKEPERVIIRNTKNEKFVIGALFRREREIPGPRLQISSDAAEALGMLAGAPSELNVTALRRETMPDPEAAPVVTAATDVVEPAADVTETALDPIASAAVAIDAPDVTPKADPTAASSAPAKTAAAAPAAKPPASPLAKPYIQIGIFNVEANANRTASQMRSAGMVPTIKEQSANGKPFWRVLVGPAFNKSDLNTLLAKIKAEGFSDAYPVTN